MAGRGGSQHAAERPPGTGRRARAVAAALVVAALTAVGPTASAAQAPTRAPELATLSVFLPRAQDHTDGLRVEATNSYVVDLAASVVRVEHEVTLTNQVPDRVIGSYLRRYYLDSYSTLVLHGATDVRASRVGGGDLGVRVEPGVSGFVDVAVISLSPNLFYGSAQTIQLTYVLPTQPLRSGSVSQVNEAFAAFPVFCAADPGLGDVSVTLLGNLDVEVVGADMERSAGDGTVTYSATDIDDPDAWFATVIARDDDALVEQTVPFGEYDVRLLGWPGDAEWLGFTGDLAERGLPVLRTTIGRDWDPDRDLTIVETTAPYVYGFGGWYEHRRSLIEIGDDLDAHVALHEMAHVWFNDQYFQGRWINEAFANEYAALAMAELELGQPVPESAFPDHPGALPLNAWAHPDLDSPEAESQEAYGYNTSWWIAHLLIEEIGVERLADVIEAAVERRSPYPAETTEATLPGTADWRTLLDLLEEVGGSGRAEGLFREFVVNPADVSLLDMRAALRETYADLLEIGDGWAPPAALRDAMADWSFEHARSLIPHVQDVFAQRDAIAADLARANEPLPVALREDIERARNLGQLDTVLKSAAEASSTLATAVTELGAAGPLARVGLLLADADEDVRSARAALADGAYGEAQQDAQGAIDDVSAATGVGTAMVGGLLLVLLLVALGVWVLRRRRRRVPDDDVPVGGPGLPEPAGTSPHPLVQESGVPGEGAVVEPA